MLDFVIILKPVEDRENIEKQPTNLKKQLAIIKQKLRHYFRSFLKPTNQLTNSISTPRPGSGKCLQQHSSAAALSLSGQTSIRVRHAVSAAPPCSLPVPT